MESPAAVDGLELCAWSHPASAYRAAAAASTALPELPAKAGNPVPCLALTGYGANEPDIGIASDCTVYCAPAATPQVCATSKLVLKGLANIHDEAGIDLSVSNEGGKTWTYQSVAPHGPDWHKRAPL